LSPRGFSGIKLFLGESGYTRQVSDWIALGKFMVSTSSDADLMEKKIKKSKSRKTVLRYLKDYRNECEGTLEILTDLGL